MQLYSILIISWYFIYHAQTIHERSNATSMLLALAFTLATFCMIWTNSVAWMSYMNGMQLKAEQREISSPFQQRIYKIVCVFFLFRAMWFFYINYRWSVVCSKYLHCSIQKCWKMVKSSNCSIIRRYYARFHRTNSSAIILQLLHQWWASWASIQDAGASIIGPREITFPTTQPTLLPYSKIIFIQIIQISPQLDNADGILFHHDCLFVSTLLLENDLLGLCVHISSILRIFQGIRQRFEPTAKDFWKKHHKS